MNHCLSLNCPATVSVDSLSLPLERLQSPPLLLENCIFTAVKPPAHKHTQIHTITHKSHTNTHNHTHTQKGTGAYGPTLLNDSELGIQGLWCHLTQEIVIAKVLGLVRKDLAPILSSLVPSSTKVAARAQA